MKGLQSPDFTGSTPALVSTDWGHFIEVMRRDNPQEMNDLMHAIYYQHLAPNIRAHEMLRLATRIVTRYADLKAEMIEVKKENSKLKRLHTRPDRV